MKDFSLIFSEGFVIDRRMSITAPPRPRQEYSAMQVSRKISDPSVAEFIQHASEEELRAAMEDVAADAELKEAIEHSLANDAQGNMSVHAFLATVGHGTDKLKSM